MSAIVFDLSFVKPFTNVHFQIASNVALKQASQSYLHVFVKGKDSQVKK